MTYTRYAKLMHLRGTVFVAWHNRVLECIFATFYCFAPQGRSMAIECMPVVDLPRLLRKRLTLSPLLKTRSKYGYQPIVLPGEGISVVRYFVLQLRAYAANKSIEHSSTRAHHPVWLKYTGEAAADVSHFVTHFFEVHMGTHTTPTNIRSLVETTSHAALMDHTISASEASSISNINGHSSAVVRDYYLRHNMTEDARNGLAAFRRMGSYANDREEEEEEAEQQHEDIDELYSFATGGSNNHGSMHTQEDWGAEHPDYYKPLHRNAKFRWTDEEILYVGRFCEQYIEDNPDNHALVISKCLSALKADSTAVPIFHRAHIMNTVRLKHGWIRFQQGV